ncbi:MAG: sigma 54-interacting transcriptional regulator [Planctomycetota bacterium]|nr:sigma 54-interacting transcriptional regulator [Planctomycetota bacterium]
MRRRQRWNRPRESAATLRALAAFAAVLLLLATRAQAAPDEARSPLAPPEPLGVRAQVLDAAPRMDGILDEWQGLPAEAEAVLARREQLHPRLGEAWSGPEDGSVRVAVAVHGDDLYLGLSFTDDVVVHEPERAWWHGDSLELFVNPDLVPGERPPHRFTPDCRQIFLMPANADLPWGVVYRGLRQVFGDGGLRGVEVVRGPEREGGYDAEARIPLVNFGITDRREARLGFALALNDADDPGAPSDTYLSWNRGFDLYLHPDHFGELTIPARQAFEPPPDPKGHGGTTWPLLLAIGLIAAVLLAGPAARLLAGIGARTKLLALGAIVVLGGAVVLEATLAADADEHAVRVELDALADRAATVATDAAAYLPDDGGTDARTLTALLRGGRVAAAPGVVGARLVALHPDGAFAPPQGVPAYGLDLRTERSFLFPQPVSANRVRMRLAAPPQMRGSASAELGTLGFVGIDGEKATARVVLPAAAKRVDVAVGLTTAWREVTWTPDPAAPPARLRGLDALAADRAVPLLLTGTTRQRVPVLAHSAGPNQGRDVAPDERLRVDLPVLAEADRVWLLLRAERAFPRLLGDHLLARVQVRYATGDAPPAREIRNGEHLTAGRRLPGIRRPQGVGSLEAFRWRDAMGITHVEQALAIPLDPQRVATGLELENLGPGGTLRLVAATVTRTRRAEDDQTVRVVTDESGRDGLLLAEGLPDFSRYLAGAARSDGDSLRRTRLLGAAAPARVTFSAPRPPSVASKRTRAEVALFVCLGLVLFLTVLLVVDAAGRLRFLTWRLGTGVLAAALVPLAVTLLLVDRDTSRRIEAEHAERVRSGAQQVEGRLDAALVRVRDAARRLARHLVQEAEPGQNAEIHRVARLYGAAALDEGLVGTVAISGAALPVLNIPLGGEGTGLGGPRFLQGAGERPGVHVSPWDGLLLVGSARYGRADDWVRVTLGVRVDDAFLAAALHEGLTDDGASATLIDDRGRKLTQTGGGAEALRRALAVRLGELPAGGAGSGVILPQVGTGDGAHLVAARRFGATAPAETRGAWLALGLRRSAIERTLTTQRQPLLWLALFGLVLVVAVATLVARRVADPVRGLVHATDAVRQGSFDVQVPDAGGDEVGRLAIAFDQMRRDLKHRVEDLDFLRNAQEALAASLDYGRRARVVVQLLKGRFAADEVMLLDARSPRGPVTVVAEAATTARFADRPFTPAPGGWLEDALRGTRPLDVNAGEAGDGEGPVGRRLLADSRAWLALPLRSGRELQGLALLGWSEPDAVPRAEARRLLEPLAGISASALNNARLYRLASLDDVTRLPGATAFEAALRTDVERAVAGGPEAVLLRIGLDHLEHVALRRDVELSRELMRACANALVGVVGDRARLGRLRGEQLAVRWPGASADEVRGLAELVRRRLASVEISPEGGGESVTTTVSIGVARCPGDARSLEFLLDAAGRALAAAQREGGDQVEDVARLDAGAVDVPPFEQGAIFRNERMVRVVESARRAARSDASVLITGETGTGKEVIAQLIHRRSARASRPFVTVNCAAFPETLLESELFGHERGAFTGAERRREGRFELADGGTLFLDEVAEMTPSAQVKLLRVLQERQFTRLGGTRTITVDVRILAATNKDLEQAVAQGEFREDLYYRLNVIRLEIPPLRERREEIPPLVDQFLRDAVRRAGSGPRGLTTAAMDVLYRHPWPGNVRELKNVIERCAVLCEADEVGPEHLQLDAGSAEGAFLAPRGAPRDDLNPRQRKLLDYLARHGRCTNREYYEMTGTSPRTGLRDLQDLMQRGLLLREGKRRGAVYRLP